MEQALTLSVRQLQWLVLLILWWLILWNSSWEFRPSMDSATYGALAKHVLTTGDWKRLHYGAQAYADFYQHPPLAIWLTALVFKVFGATDLTSKILPNIVALGTIIGVVTWGRSLRSEWTGFVAGFVLLASVRFTKYSVGLLLDTPMTFFLVWGGLAQLRAVNAIGESRARKAVAYGAATGISFFLAFLSKGMPAIALPCVFAICGSAICIARPSRLGLTAAATAAALLCTASGFALWFWLGDGLLYLQEYWHQSVQGRVGGASWESHLAPLSNLLRVYWPWLPFYLWGLIAAYRQLRTKKLEAFSNTSFVAAFFSISILGGFVTSGHFLEHYLVPFYPFAAVIVAMIVAPKLEAIQAGFLKFFLTFGLVYAMILATLPIHVHGVEYRNPVREILKRAPAECSSKHIQVIHISNKVADIWLGLAMGLWYTPWDARVADASGIVPNNKAEILIATTSETLHADWERTKLMLGDFILFQKQGAEVCPSALR
jgi:4-amino-4-deoxy-L-arabinose transferase-like glycosyltransferase